MLSFSAACERNKGPILERIKPLLADSESVLEIGSGTGQHAVFFAGALPQLAWQPSDRREELAELQGRIDAEGPVNLRDAVAIDVRDDPWPVTPVDALFSANSLHIMSAGCVRHFFRGAGQVVRPGGLLIAYGPFRYAGEYTSESNASFDLTLRARDPASGLRDFETLDAYAFGQSFHLLHDYAMPANNQLLVWRRSQ